MPINLNIVRGILRQLAIEPPDSDFVIAESLFLSPPSVPGYREEEVRPHLKLLEEKGWIFPTHEIRMRSHPDPVTYRASDDAKEWVRRACDDAQWDASADELLEALETADSR